MKIPKPIVRWAVLATAMLQHPATAEERVRVELVPPDPTRTGRYVLGGGLGDPLGIRSTQQRSAAQGLATARANVIGQYNAAAERTADGVEDRVIAFLKERIRNGSVDAAIDLGERYEKGKGVPMNQAEALSLYRLAATRGSSKGTNEAARIETLVRQTATNQTVESAGAKNVR